MKIPEPGRLLAGVMLTKAPSFRRPASSNQPLTARSLLRRPRGGDRRVGAKLESTEE